jgi:hypothetical protein
MASKEAIMMLQGAAQNWSSFVWDTTAWHATATQYKEARDAAVPTRKQLAETTKQFKRSVKAVETAGTNLANEQSEVNSSTTVKAIEAMSKSCRVAVKAYQGKAFPLVGRLSHRRLWFYENPSFTVPPKRKSIT